MKIRCYKTNPKKNPQKKGTKNRKTYVWGLIIMDALGFVGSWILIGIIIFLLWLKTSIK